LFYFSKRRGTYSPPAKSCCIQAVTDVVKYKLGFAEIEQGRPATVKDAAMAFKEICYEYRF